jgi:hypothetical protein
MYRIEYQKDSEIIKTIILGTFEIIPESEIVEELKLHQNSNYDCLLFKNDELILKLSITSP